MIKQIIKFIGFLLVVLCTVFIIHGFIQHYLSLGFYSNHLFVSYLFNFLATLVFYCILLLFLRKKSAHLGTIFFTSSLIKFILFFLLIKPLYNNINNGVSAVFFAFFIPYAISMFLETYSIISIINKEEVKKNDK